MVKLVLPDGTEKKSLLRAGSFVPTASGNKISTVAQYLMCYSGLNLLRITVDTENHTISAMSAEEEHELEIDESI